MQLQLGAGGWSETQRASVLSDLQHTLAGQGIAACSADAHPAAAALATLTVDLSPEDTAKATVDIEVRDAVTRKRVRRDVDLSRVPDDGRAAAIAIEADELLRASWAEIALDTARAREAQAAGPTAGRRQRAAGAGAGARGGRRRPRRARARSNTTSAASTLVGADGVGRVRPVAAARAGDRGRAAARSVGDRAARPVSALARGRRPGAADPDRRRRGARSLAAGAGATASWLEFRAEPSPGAEAATYANLLAAANAAAGRPAGARVDRSTRAPGSTGGVALRGVEATDAGLVVARARGAVLGATLGLEAP